MFILKGLLESISDGEVQQVCIGLHWTAVVVDVEGVQRCGLASTISGRHQHGRGPDVPQAGELEASSGRELAALALCGPSTQTSIGVAALNALLPMHESSWVEANAEDLLATQGKDKRVALVGSFPFVNRLRDRVGELFVLEKEPGFDEFPAQEAPGIIPGADVVAITGMTLINHTLEGLLKLCNPRSFVMILGPSTPLSPLLFDYGIDLLSGSIVTDIDPVLRVVVQGGNFRQVHRAGVRLVNMKVFRG